MSVGTPCMGKAASPQRIRPERLSIRRYQDAPSCSILPCPLIRRLPKANQCILRRTWSTDANHWSGCLLGSVSSFLIWLRLATMGQHYHPIEYVTDCHLPWKRGPLGSTSDHQPSAHWFKSESTAICDHSTLDSLESDWLSRSPAFKIVSKYRVGNHSAINFFEISEDIERLTREEADLQP